LGFAGAGQADSRIERLRSRRYPVALAGIEAQPMLVIAMLVTVLPIAVLERAVHRPRAIGRRLRQGRAGRRSCGERRQGKGD
jgi:hypothetical protein